MVVRVVVPAGNKDGVCLAACLLAENKDFGGLPVKRPNAIRVAHE